MRQHLSRPRAFALFMIVLLFSILAPECRAAEATKQDDTPLQVKIVEIKGTKVRLPIPDGYEEMKREDHPVTYDWMVEVTEVEGELPLAYLINTHDKEARQKDNSVPFRFAIAYSSEDFWDANIEDNAMRSVRRHFLKYISDMAKGVNELLREEGKPEMDYSMIYNGKKSISSVHIGRSSGKGKRYKEGMTESYIVLDTKIIDLLIYKEIYNKQDVDSLINETKTYLKKIDQGRY